MRGKILRISFLIIIIAAISPAINLQNESLGGIKLGDNFEVIIKKLGPPKIKSKGSCGPGYGYYWSIYKWPSQGITVNVERESKEVIGISVSGKSQAQTSIGIGIGSTKDEVKKAYSEDCEEGMCGNGNDWDFQDGDEGILHLIFARDKVVAIHLSYLFCE